MPRAKKVCSTPGCPAIIPAGQGRCEECKRKAEAERGTSTQRGYGGAGHKAFRQAVLARDPICMMGDCLRPSRHADHHWIPPGETHPWGRREIVAAGLNPNDPKYGRGLCGPCHSRATAKHQPGGWNRR
jgi:hypothetical protein